MQRKKLFNIMLIVSMLSIMLGVTPAWAVTANDALTGACVTPRTLSNLGLIAVPDGKGFHPDSLIGSYGGHFTFKLEKNGRTEDVMHIYETKIGGCYVTTTNRSYARSAERITGGNDVKYWLQIERTP